MGVSEQKVHSVCIQVANYDLPQGWNPSPGYVCDLCKELVRIAEIPFCNSYGLLAERMAGDYILGKLLVPGSSFALQQGLNLGIAAQDPLNGMRESGMTQVMEQAS